MSEIAIFQTSNVKITKTKVVINDTTYVLSNITSVKIEKIELIRSFGIILGVISVILSLTGIVNSNFSLSIIATLCLGIGILMHKFGVSWELIITTGAAEKHALQSQNKELILNVMTAINLAIENKNQ